VKPVLAAEADVVAFRDELLENGVLIATGVAGLYGFGPIFEDVRLHFEALVARVASDDGPQIMRFPPLLPRAQLESSAYLASFPHLAGSVFVFEGSEADALLQQERASRHEDWSEFQRMSELALTPAACYPVYPAIAMRGALEPGGVVVDAGGAWVFRHEPSEDAARMQMFHQRELVRIGAPDEVLAWRDRWREQGLALLAGLGLPVEADRAADAFFGRSGRMLAANQRSQELKYELLVPIAGSERTAVASFNYHRDHFATLHGLVLANGDPAHTACLGFGEERIVLALLRTHGFDLGRWPAEVRTELWGG
jgi:seryl-tRNA synthetase